MCLPVVTPMAILSKEDGGKQEMSQLLEVLHPPRAGLGTRCLVGSRKQGRAVSLGRLRAGPGSGTLRFDSWGCIPGCLLHSTSSSNAPGLWGHSG